MLQDRFRDIAALEFDGHEDVHAEAERAWNALNDQAADAKLMERLRHTCASLAISAGANVKVVQRLLGRKTAVLTLDRYGHLFPNDLDAVANAFDAAADDLRTVTAVKPVAATGNSF